MTSARSTLLVDQADVVFGVGRAAFPKGCLAVRVAAASPARLRELPAVEFLRQMWVRIW